MFKLFTVVPFMVIFKTFFVEILSGKMSGQYFFIQYDFLWKFFEISVILSQFHFDLHFKGFKIVAIFRKYFILILVDGWKSCIFYSFKKWTMIC